MDAEKSSLSFHFLDTEEYNLEEKILIISLPISILGFIGNSVILWILCCRIRIKLNLYFVCVATANNIIAFTIIAEYVMFFRSASFSLMYHRVLHVLHLSSDDASFFIFTVIAAERWCILFFPVWYKQFRPVNFSAMVSFTLWGLTSLLSIVSHYLCTPVLEVHFKSTEKCTSSTIILIITQLIFIPSIIFFLGGIWIRIHMRQEEASPMRLDVTILATVLLFLILTVPFNLARILLYWIDSIDGYILGSLNTLMEAVSCSIGPFIYLFVGYWKKPKMETPFGFLEIALSDKTTVLVKTPTKT